MAFRRYVCRILEGINTWNDCVLKFKLVSLNFIVNSFGAFPRAEKGAKVPLLLRCTMDNPKKFLPDPDLKFIAKVEPRKYMQLVNLATLPPLAAHFKC